MGNSSSTVKLEGAIYMIEQVIMLLKTDKLNFRINKQELSIKHSKLTSWLSSNRILKFASAIVAVQVCKSLGHALFVVTQQVNKQLLLALPSSLFLTKVTCFVKVR